MSDIGVAEIPVDDDERPLPPPQAPVKNALVEGPILRTLLWLAWPNVIALSAGTCVVIAETSYIGRLGVELLAAMALVFPFVILTMTMSGGAMGGGVASAIARAIGAGDIDRASTLAAHALLIGICLGLVFMLGMLIFGPTLLELLGGRGNVLALRHRLCADLLRRRGGALADEHLGGILRGTGNMKLPSLLMLSSAACQIVLGGMLGLGLGPIPSFGMRGVAAGSLVAYVISVSVMAWYIFSGPGARGSQDQGPSHSMGDVLRYPEGRRGLLFLAAAVGADRRHLHPHAGAIRHRNSGRLRRRRPARIHADLDRVRGRHRLGADGRDGDRRAAGGAGAADRLDRGLCLLRLGRRWSPAVIAIFPDLWVNIFTDDPSVRAASRQYLSTAAPMYAFIGLSISMYFSSQGAAKVLGPVLAQTARLVFIAAGGWWLSTYDATAANYFALAAASMVVLGVLSAASVIFTRWGPKGGPAPDIRPALS